MSLFLLRDGQGRVSLACSRLRRAGGCPRTARPRLQRCYPRHPCRRQLRAAFSRHIFRAVPRTAHNQPDFTGGSHAHDHHRRRHGHLLQGLGIGPAGRVQPRLAAVQRRLGHPADVLPAARLPRHRQRPARPRTLRPGPRRPRHGPLRRRPRRRHQPPRPPRRGPHRPLHRRRRSRPLHRPARREPRGQARPLPAARRMLVIPPGTALRADDIR
jgi:hypothetical protein